MGLNFSETRTGNLILLVGACLWLIGYWMNAIAFAWLFISLGFLTAMMYQLDRALANGRNSEHETDVPPALCRSSNGLITICLLFAIWEFAMALVNR